MSEVSNTPSVPDAYALRSIVARWLRIRTEHIADSIGIAGGSVHLGVSEQRAVLAQLANDADHSDLLVRLFMGEEPLPFEEWRNR